jgi:hypothetical protein
VLLIALLQASSSVLGQSSSLSPPHFSTSSPKAVPPWHFILGARMYRVLDARSFGRTTTPPHHHRLAISCYRAASPRISHTNPLADNDPSICSCPALAFYPTIPPVTLLTLSFPRCTLYLVLGRVQRTMYFSSGTRISFSRML